MPSRQKVFMNACFTSYMESLTLTDTENVCYYVIGKETCPTTGRKHLQGFIQLIRPRVMKSLQKIIGDPDCHVEEMRGTATEASTYCKKEHLLSEWGNLRTQGERTDFDEIKKKVLENGRMPAEIIDMNLQQIRHAEKLLQYSNAKRSWKTIVYWFWGKTGSGKTKAAWEEDPNAWVAMSNLNYWEGYNGEETVIFDDFRGDYCKFHELLKIFDRYPYRVNVKFGSRQLLAKKIIVTCPYPPDEVYENREDINQLMRRIDKIVKFE